MGALRIPGDFGLSFIVHEGFSCAAGLETT